MPPFPIYVIPYPLPIVPSPGSCPCYLLNPGQGNSGTSPTQNPQAVQGQGQGQGQTQGYAPYGIIGFVPVVFVPYCPGNNTDMQHVQPNFPNAVPVPYNCAQCQANNDVYRYFGRANGARSTDFNELKEIRSLPELESLIKHQIKPLRKSLPRIAAHPRILDSESDSHKSKKKE